MKQIFVEHAKKVDHNRDKVDIHHVNNEGMLAIKTHFHCLVMTGLGMNGVPENIDSISSRTGLRKSLVEEILGDLLSGNLVTKEGSCYRLNNDFTFATPKTEEEVNHYRAISFDQIDYSVKLLMNEPMVKNSSLNGFYFAGNSNKFQTAKKMLDEAVLKVAVYMCDEGKNDTVYSLTLQCVNLQS